MNYAEPYDRSWRGRQGSPFTYAVHLSRIFVVSPEALLALEQGATATPFEILRVSVTGDVFQDPKKRFRLKMYIDQKTYTAHSAVQFHPDAPAPNIVVTKDAGAIFTTAGTMIKDEVFDTNTGFVWQTSPGERIIIPGDNGFQIANHVSSATVTATIIWREFR